MSDKLPSAGYQALQRYIEALYRAAGLSKADADICADCTVRTNLWGVDSHGVLRTAAYIERILAKAVNPTPKVRFTAAKDGPLSLMDGDAGMGYVVATLAMKEAMAKARKFGFGAILVKNSNHFGAASLFARMASDAGMLGIATTNALDGRWKFILPGNPGNLGPDPLTNTISVALPSGASRLAFPVAVK